MHVSTFLNSILHILCLGHPLVPCGLSEHPSLFSSVFFSNFDEQQQKPRALLCLGGSMGIGPQADTGKAWHFQSVSIHFYWGVLWCWQKSKLDEASDYAGPDFCSIFHTFAPVTACIGLPSSSYVDYNRLYWIKNKCSHQWALIPYDLCPH